MIKKIKAIVKLAINAGKANPTPPIGPVLGQYGINIINFCKEYNAKTQEFNGLIIPVKITIYEDKSYTFILKSSPASNLLLNSAKLLKGSGQPNKNSIGTISYNDVKNIALKKLNDLNTKNIDKAILIILGTAKNMGLIVNN